MCGYTLKTRATIEVYLFLAKMFFGWWGTPKWVGEKTNNRPFHFLFMILAVYLQH